MRKLYTTPEYKRKHNRRLQAYSLKKRRLKRYKINHPKEKEELLKDFKLKDIVIAPSDFRLFGNTSGCLKFFKELRSDNFLNTFRRFKYVRMTLKNVTKIDYAAISILTAINDDFGAQGIIIQGDFPDDIQSRALIAESGYLDHILDMYGRKYQRYHRQKSDLVYFEKGKGKLSSEEQRKISNMLKNVVDHMGGNDIHRLKIKTILLEICGNSLEWSEATVKQWLLGIKYESNKVIFTVTDVGKGIIDTLNIKLQQMFLHSVMGKKPLDILKGAFQQKYGSKSEEKNRNKGLPAIREASESGLIKNLKVVTNEVILNFEDDTQSNNVPQRLSFGGTFYQWELDCDCMNKINS